MAILIDGKAIAEQVRGEIREETTLLREQHGIVPGLGLLLIGNDPASEVYVKMKGKACEEVGFHSVTLRRPDTITQEQVLDIINDWNNDPAIHGILVQLPLPKHIDSDTVLQAIAPEKDVDGFHPVNAGRLALSLPCFVPCTPLGVIELLKRHNIQTKGKHAVVVGRSNIVGRPMATLLSGRGIGGDAIVSITHRYAEDLSYYTRQADILVVAVGIPHLIKAADIKEGAVVIDVGINKIDAPERKSGYRLVGDVDFDSAIEKASHITPVPGGVGPMTIAMLMKNTLTSAQRHCS